MCFIPREIREKITHLHSNGLHWYPLDPESNFPNLTFLKSLNSTFIWSDEFSRKIQELRCTETQDLKDFTGKCRIYEYRRTDSNRKRSYKLSMIQNGEKIVEK